MTEKRTTRGRFTTDPRRREQALRQVIRARRSVDGDMRDTTATGDPAKRALVERAKRWVAGDGPGGPAPGSVS